MTPRTSRWWVLAGGAVAVLALRTTVAGQAPQTNQDTLAALLVEVRGLRGAMEQMASAGPRIQLAIGRLQLQEQRVNTMVRRADALRESIATAQKEVAAFQDKIGEMQQALEHNGVPSDARGDIEAQVAGMKKHVARSMGEVQRLQAEEADAASQVAGEQARWVEINQRLEELDRALTRR